MPLLVLLREAFALAMLGLLPGWGSRSADLLRTVKLLLGCSAAVYSVSVCPMADAVH
jgi:hypothetical protein